MSVTVLPSNARGDASVASVHEASRTKIIFIVLLFLLSLTSFVLQTEFTSQAYQLGFSEPLIMLFVTHGLWWVLWPLQVLGIATWRTWNKLKQQNHAKSETGAHYQRLNSNSQLLENGEGETSTPAPNMYKYFKKCIVKQVHNVYHTSILIYEANVNNDTSTFNCNELIGQNPRVSNSSSLVECFKTLTATPSFRYIFFKTFLICIVLTVAGGTWYGAMSMTYASDVTAIYNCSAFTAYAFAIPILHDKFSWLKASSVLVAISGVFIVAYSDDGASDDDQLYPYRLWGNLIIFIGAILYGYYEVLYKKYTCIPAHLAKIITPRRQSTFANFVMALLGFFTCIILATIVIFCEVSGVHTFNLFDYGSQTLKIWMFIFGSIIGNLLFSASFLSLMALTSPVLSSVSSLLTIFLIGIVEWVVFGNKLSFQQLVGDFFVVVGFVLLTTASWKEISEGNDDDDVENVSTYSFAPSTDG